MIKLVPIPLTITLKFNKRMEHCQLPMRKKADNASCTLHYGTLPITVLIITHCKVVKIVDIINLKRKIINPYERLILVRVCTSRVL